jgi:hypothetical protein
MWWYRKAIVEVAVKERSPLTFYNLRHNYEKQKYTQPCTVETWRGAR